MKDRRLFMYVGALLLLFLLGLAAQSRIFTALGQMLPAVVSFFVLLAVDCPLQKPLLDVGRLLLCALPLVLFLLYALAVGGELTYFAYPLAAVLALQKTVLYPHRHGKGLYLWVTVLTLLSAYAAKPFFCSAIKIEHLHSVWNMSLFPLVLSCVLYDALRPAVLEKRPQSALLLLLAFVLMTMTMSHLWYAWFQNYRVDTGTAGEFAGVTVKLYRNQPLLLLALLELFLPVSRSFFLTSRHIRKMEANQVE